MAAGLELLAEPVMTAAHAGRATTTTSTIEESNTGCEDVDSLDEVGSPSLLLLVVGDTAQVSLSPSLLFPWQCQPGRSVGRSVFRSRYLRVTGI